LQKLVANIGTPLQPRQYVDGQELEGAAKTGVWEGHAHTGSRDSERRGIGKDSYRLSRDGEEESEQMILAVPLEGSFSAPFLFLPIHSHLHNLLELLLLAIDEPIFVPGGVGGGPDSPL
jgi:hypothetical protein